MNFNPNNVSSQIGNLELKTEMGECHVQKKVELGAMLYKGVELKGGH